MLKKTKLTVLSIFLILACFSFVFALVTAPDKPTILTPENASTNNPLTTIISVNATDSDDDAVSTQLWQYVSSDGFTDDTSDNVSGVVTCCSATLNTTAIDDQVWTSASTYVDSVTELYLIPSNVTSANLTIKIVALYQTENYTVNCKNISSGNYLVLYSNRECGENCITTHEIPNDCISSGNTLTVYTDGASECCCGGFCAAVSRPYMNYFESEVKWFGTEIGLLSEETNTSGSSFSYSWANLEENMTYQWYAIANDTTETNTSDTFTFTTGFAPDINSWNITNTSAEYLDSTDFWANVTDLDGDDVLNVTYYCVWPNATISEFYNTTGSPFYNSSSFTFEKYGNYDCNITAYSNNTDSTTQALNIDISIGNQTSNPSSWSFAQQSGNISTEDFNITHTADSWVEYNASIEGDFTNASRFSYELIADSFNISRDESKIVQLNITSVTANVTNTTYTGNLTITRTYDNQQYRVPITLSMSTTGVGDIDLIGYTSNYKSLTINSGATSSWDLKVNNTGSRTLTGCNVTLIGTASSFTTLTNALDFSLAVNSVHTTTVSHSPSSTGNYQGTITVICTATAEGGTDTEVMTEDISVISSASGGGGGGGGSGQSTCDFTIPDKLILSKNDPIERLIIKNNEQSSFLPRFSILPVTGEPDGSELIGIDGAIGTILTNSQGEVAVVIEDVNNLEGLNETYFAKIEVSSSECLPKFTEVEIRTNEFDLFPTSFDEALQKITGFQTKEIITLGDVPIYVFYVSLVLGMIILTSVYTVVSKNSRKFVLSKTLFIASGLIIIMEILIGMVV